MAKKSKTQSLKRKAPTDLTPRKGRVVKGGGGEVTTRNTDKNQSFKFFLNVETLP